MRRYRRATRSAGSRRSAFLGGSTRIALTSVGITNYFGVPGGAIEPLFNALSRQQRAGLVNLTPTRSEAGAAFAADGYYRATGRIAVCTTTTGPGITNLLTAVMSAHADRIAMLVITPQVALSKQGRGALQDSSSDGYDLEKMLSECTRYSSIVTHADQLAHKLVRALSIALSSPTGRGTIIRLLAFRRFVNACRSWLSCHSKSERGARYFAGVHTRRLWTRTSRRDSVS